MKARCIVCLKELQYLWDSFVAISSETLTAMDNANDFIIYGGYGSCHDTEIMKAFICDCCLSSRREMAIVLTMEKVGNDE